MDFAPVQEYQLVSLDTPEKVEWINARREINRGYAVRLGWTEALTEDQYAAWQRAFIQKQ